MPQPDARVVDPSVPLQQAVWIRLTVRATLPCRGEEVRLQLTLRNGRSQVLPLPLCDLTAVERLLLPLDDALTAVEVLTAPEPLELSWQTLAPATAALALARELCADDPSTLYRNPLALRQEIDQLGLDPLDRLWGRYRRFLQERPRPLFSRTALSRRQLPIDFRHPDDTLALVRALAVACERRHDPALPLVSIVIPTYGKDPYTLRCIESVLQAQLRQPLPRQRLELIVIDDAAPPEDPPLLPALEGLPAITLLRNPDNLGFLRSCNRAAGQATGDWICFLNNDTVVADGWLDELLDCFRWFPDAGLVGPMLLYPGGSLQEAGGIVWQDGSAWNYGRNGDPENPAYSFARDVDYISGACILLPTALFRELGGFDGRYSPAYYEDTDLALAVKASGRRVIYQPRSRVIHFEGISSGRDEESGAKRFQLRNQQLFFRKWQSHLASHGPNAHDVLGNRNRGRRARILVLESCTPTPDQDAGSYFMVVLLWSLLLLGYDVSFIAVDNLLYMPDYSGWLQRLGVEVISHPHIDSLESHLQEAGSSYDAVLLARPDVAERALTPLKTHAPHARLLYYTHDLHHLRLERQQQVNPGAVSADDIEGMRRLEKEVVDVVDGVLYLSDSERDEAVRRLQPRSRPHVLPPPLAGRRAAAGHGQRSDLVFLGGFRHPPNVDAALFFVGEVMPLLRQAGSGLRLHLVGAAPPAAILELAGPDVIVHGHVDDLDGLLATRRIAIAPLRYGAGVKGKVLTMLGAGVPLVGTAVAAEGIGLRDGITYLRAEEPAEFARSILELHRSAELWQSIADAAHRHGEEGWGLAGGLERLRAILADQLLPVPEVCPAWVDLPPLTGLRLGPEGLLCDYTLRGHG